MFKWMDGKVWHAIKGFSSRRVKMNGDAEAEDAVSGNRCCFRIPSQK